MVVIPDICIQCRGLIPKGEVFRYKKGHVCKKCLIKLSKTGIICPNCGAPVDPADDTFTLLSAGNLPHLTFGCSPYTSPIIICPECRILFLDEVHYNSLMYQRTHYQLPKG